MMGSSKGLVASREVSEFSRSLKLLAKGLDVRDCAVSDRGSGQHADRVR